MSDSDVFSTSPGNRPQQFNVGVKRITGAQLVAAGKRINWVYYITDIQCCAVYENAGRNVWLGTNGIPVAGDSTIQASLIPVQGQRFYNLTTGPQEWKGTSWGAGSYAVSNKLTPRIRLLPDGNSVLSPEVEHYVQQNNQALLFPPADYTDVGTSMDVFVGPTVTGTTVSAGAGFHFSTVGQPNTPTLPLNAGGIYKLVRIDADTIEVISTDSVDPVLRKSANLSDVGNAALARANLDVYGTDEVHAIAAMLTPFGAGIQITGSPASIVNDPVNGFFRISLIFDNDPASVLNATASTAPSILTPWAAKGAILQAVQDAVGMSQFNNISGLAFNSQTFSVTVNANLTSIDIGEAVWLFNVDPYLRNQQLVVRPMPATNMALAIPAGPSYLYITLSTVGNYTASTTYDPTDFTKVIVARVYCVDGQIRWALATPAIASSDMSLRSQAIATSGSLLKAKAGGQWLSAEVGSIYEEGVGWSQAQNNPHTLNYPAADDVLIDIVNTDGSIYALAAQHVRGNLLADGGAVATTEYTVQIVYRMLNGRYLVPRPSTKYTDKATAVAAIASVTFAKPAWMAEAVEVCRWVVKGDQFQGSGAYNISNIVNFEARAITTYAGGAASGGSSNWEILGVTGGGTLLANKIYIFQDSATYSFPAIGPIGQGISLMALSGAVPSIMVQNYPTVYLKETESNTNHDGVQLTLPWSLETFFSTGTFWGW